MVSPISSTIFTMLESLVSVSPAWCHAYRSELYDISPASAIISSPAFAASFSICLIADITSRLYCFVLFATNFLYSGSAFRIFMTSTLIFCVLHPAFLRAITLSSAVSVKRPVFFILLAISAIISCSASCINSAALSPSISS